MVTRVYTASSSCSTTIKKQQQEVIQYLESHSIDFEVVDITMSEEQRQWMYRSIPKDKWPEHGNPLPPQIYNDVTYCGVQWEVMEEMPQISPAFLMAAVEYESKDYNDFFEAKESNSVYSFLQIKQKTKDEEL